MIQPTNQSNMEAMIKALQSRARKVPRYSKERAEIIQLTKDLLAGRPLTQAQQWLIDYLSFLTFELEAAAPEPMRPEGQPTKHKSRRVMGYFFMIGSWFLIGMISYQCGL